MNWYIVTVRDDVSEQVLAVPCAEEETAQLVCKNLSTLFPKARVEVSEDINNSAPTANNNRHLTLLPKANQIELKRKSKIFELEEELFDDVA